MITKERFISTMNWLDDLDHRMKNVNRAMKKLDDNFCGLYISEIVEIIVDIMSDALDDKYSDLAFFVYECDLLHGDMTIMERNSNKYITTWEQVYDYITGVDTQ